MKPRGRHLLYGSASPAGCWPNLAEVLRAQVLCALRCGFAQQQLLRVHQSCWLNSSSSSAAVSLLKITTNFNDSVSLPSRRGCLRVFFGVDLARLLRMFWSSKPGQPDMGAQNTFWMMGLIMLGSTLGASSSRHVEHVLSVLCLICSFVWLMMLLRWWWWSALNWEDFLQNFEASEGTWIHGMNFTKGRLHLWRLWNIFFFIFVSINFSKNQIQLIALHHGLGVHDNEIPTRN